MLHLKSNNIHNIRVTLFQAIVLPFYLLKYNFIDLDQPLNQYRHLFIKRMNILDTILRTLHQLFRSKLFFHPHQFVEFSIFVRFIWRHPQRTLADMEEGCEVNKIE